MSLVDSMTVRQRLERRLHKKTVSVSFKDDLGEFTVEIRLMSPNEQKNLMGIYQKLNAYLAKKPKKETAQNLLVEGTKLLEEVYSMAGYLCVDSDLDADYWKAGEGFNIDIPLKIIRTAISESQKVEQQTRKFRGNR